MTRKFRGKIIDGVFLPWATYRTAYAGYMRRMAKLDIVECIIQPPKDPKSMSQLAYFHAVVCRVASEASGYEIDEVKEILKYHFLKRMAKSKKTGKEFEYTPSLADMKKDEMSIFIDDCIRLIAEHWGAIVPAPGEIAY